MDLMTSLTLHLDPIMKSFILFYTNKPRKICIPYFEPYWNFISPPLMVSPWTTKPSVIQIILDHADIMNLSLDTLCYQPYLGIHILRLTLASDILNIKSLLSNLSIYKVKEIHILNKFIIETSHPKEDRKVTKYIIY